MKNCALIGGGEFAEAAFDARTFEYVIALDGGYRYVAPHADVLVGDLDSLGYCPQGIEVLRHNPHKDQTDLELGIETAVARGYRELHLFGVLGKRLDHTIAALTACVAAAKRGISVTVHGVGQTVYFVTDRLQLTGRQDCYLSVFAFEPTRVSASGVEYPLDNMLLQGDMPIGVSNEMLAAEIPVTVTQGCAIVIVQEKDNRALDCI